MRLIVEQGELAGQAFALDRPSVLIGRGKDCDIVLLESDISRQHARLQRGPQGLTLVDLGTTNGTFVNGKRLPPDDPYLLRAGDRITIGSSVLAVQGEGSGRERGQSAPHREPTSPVLLAAGAVLFVLVLAGIVALLVTLLQPKDALVTPTPMNQGEQIMTALPVPTEAQEMVSTAVPLLATMLPDLPLGATSTPSPPGVGIPAGPGGATAPDTAAGG